MPDMWTTRFDFWHYRVLEPCQEKPQNEPCAPPGVAPILCSMKALQFVHSACSLTGKGVQPCSSLPMACSCLCAPACLSGL